MLKVIGSTMCKDTMNAVDYLKAHQIPFEFFNITESMPNLREFMKLRDTLDAEAHARETHMVGIPLFVLDDGRMTTNTDLVFGQYTD